MEKAYVRRLEDSVDFHLSFHFQHEVYGINRQFNFNRQLSENVKELLSRIQTSIDKSLTKYKKKLKKQKSEQTLDDSCEIPVILMRDGEPVPGDTECRDVLFGEGRLCLRIFTTEFVVVLNAPWINMITLPTSIMVGFPVSPNRFETVFTLKDCSLFTWYRGDNKNEDSWFEVGSGFYYTPTVNDLGYHLKVTCVPGNKDKKGLPADAVSKNSVEAGPGQCPFELRHLFTAERIHWPSFRVISYNILADLYADSDVARTQLFPYCPPYALDMDYRKQLILKEILGYHGDIICLQEVDSKVFNRYLEPVLTCEGFTGIFEKKGGGQVSEGLAFFFHNTKFRLLDCHSICLAEELKERPTFAELWGKIKTNEPFVTRFLARKTSVYVVVLECINEPEKLLVVGNTHLYFHPDADHIRLFQAAMAILYVQEIVSALSVQLPEKQISTIMCGDFNSTPDCGVYQLMTTQFIPTDYQDWNSNVGEAVKGVSLSHSIPLESACGTPEFTNFTAGFAGCLDYIFYQRNTLSVKQVVPLPTEEELRLHVALPNVVFPSDHVALVADITWRTSM
ncbi:2',5'-phosphodiesterase 12 isoform X2 [Anabrus simplex]